MKTIYILEDSKIVSELLKYNLKNEFNCTVHFFENSIDLFDSILFSEVKIDLIILDHFIDNELNENGLFILKKLKKNYIDIPVIMFSGQHDLRLSVEMINAGATDYIDKNDDYFLENLNESIKLLFKFHDTVKKTVIIKRHLKKDKKQIMVLSLISILFLIVSLSVN